MKHKRNWVIGIVLSATATFIALQTVPAPEQEAPPLTIATGNDASIPHCAYTWAYHDAPDLTAWLDASLKQLNPAAKGNASLYGEDCTTAEGTVSFVPMETDFYVHLPVEDLADEEALGRWMAQVMPVVMDLPREQIPGPQYGFVEFWFERGETEKIVVRVPIQRFPDDAQQLTGAELFALFYHQP